MDDQDGNWQNGYSPDNQRFYSYGRSNSVCYKFFTYYDGCRVNQ